MLRFVKVILWNLPRAYMIPRMAYRARHGEKYSEEECYRYAQLAIRRMMRAGHISTQKYGTEHLPEEGGYMMFPNHQKAGQERSAAVGADHQGADRGHEKRAQIHYFSGRRLS